MWLKRCLFRVLAKPRIKNKKDMKQQDAALDMLLGWTRFHDLPFLGEEAFFTCRGRMLHIRTETFLGNRGRSKDRRGCGRTFSVLDVSLTAS